MGILRASAFNSKVYFIPADSSPNSIRAELDKCRIIYVDGTDSADCIIIDTPLLSKNTVYTVEKIRKNSDAPIFIITTIHNASLSCILYRCGADLVLSKPIKYNEIELRLQVFLRRYKAAIEVRQSYAGFLLTYMSLQLPNKSEIKLTPIQYEFLRLFFSRPEQNLGQHYVMQAIYGPSWNAGNIRTFDVVRNKLNKHLLMGGLSIITFRNWGYSLINHNKNKNGKERFIELRARTTFY